MLLRGVARGGLLGGPAVKAGPYALQGLNGVSEQPVRPVRRCELVGKYGLLRPLYSLLDALEQLVRLVRRYKLVSKCGLLRSLYNLLDALEQLARLVRRYELVGKCSLYAFKGNLVSKHSHILQALALNAFRPSNIVLGFSSTYRRGCSGLRSYRFLT